MKSVCLAILNYNGQRHLEHLLPSACAVAKAYSGNCSVIVLDNCSTENDVAWLAREFPSVEVVVAPKNDFLFSYNWLAQQRTEEIVVLLNNDLKLHSNFLSPLVRHFRDADVFAVTASSRDWDDRMFTMGPAVLKCHHGVYEWDYNRERQELCHTFYCSGGFSAVDRRKFLELKGFNRLFWPGYTEDVDLGFRAWRKGWRCIFEPASTVLHRENGTWGGSGDRVSRLCLRNGLLFQWSSLPKGASWLERAVFLNLTAIRKLRRGQSWWLRVWIATWWEWLGMMGNYRAQKIPTAELAVILARASEPVKLPAQ